MLLVLVSQGKFLRSLRSMTDPVSYKNVIKITDKPFFFLSYQLSSLNNNFFFALVVPEVDLDASVKERMVVHAGGVIRIIAYISGQPPPDVTWSRDGSVPPFEAKVETTAISSSLVIKPCTRKHLGVYTLMAKNAAGEKKKNITVEVLGMITLAKINKKFKNNK